MKPRYKIALRFFISLLAAPWIFVFFYFGDRCWLPPDSSTVHGIVDCVGTYAITAPLYMAVGPLVYIDGQEPPHGPVPWILTALALTGLWQIVAWTSVVLRKWLRAKHSAPAK